MLNFLAKRKRKKLLTSLGFDERSANIMADYSFIDSLKDDPELFEKDWKVFFKNDAEFARKMQTVGLSESDFEIFIINHKKINKNEQIHLTFGQGLEITANKIIELCQQRNILEVSKRLQECIQKPVKDWTNEDRDFYQNNDILNIIVFVAVYGHLSAGKSYFVQRLIRLLQQKGYVALTNDNTPEPSTYDFYDKTSPNFLPFYLPHVRIFQLPWYFDYPSVRYRYYLERDPNIQIDRLIKRKIDLNIAIYHPSFKNLKGVYDLTICNTNSKNKARGRWN